MNDRPRARSLAIRTRRVGSGAVDGGSSRQARKQGVSRPCRAAAASPRAVSSTCSATAVISGGAEAYGSSRPSRYTVPRRRISSARSVAARPGPGRQRVRMSGWKNSSMACCTVVTVLPTVSGEPCSAPASSPSQNRAACGCCCRISAGYLDEFTFRFNRRNSRARGMLFYRLLQQAVDTDPHPLTELIRGY